MFLTLILEFFKIDDETAVVEWKDAPTGFAELAAEGIKDQVQVITESGFKADNALMPSATASSAASIAE